MILFLLQSVYLNVLKVHKYFQVCLFDHVKELTWIKHIMYIVTSLITLQYTMFYKIRVCI